MFRNSYCHLGFMSSFRERLAHNFQPLFLLLLWMYKNWIGHNIGISTILRMSQNIICPLTVLSYFGNYFHASPCIEQFMLKGGAWGGNLVHQCWECNFFYTHTHTPPTAVASTKTEKFEFCNNLYIHMQTTRGLAKGLSVGGGKEANPADGADPKDTWWGHAQSSHSIVWARRGGKGNSVPFLLL